MAQTFFPIDPVEVTPGTADSWEDVDVSSYVPSGATGVILHIVNNHFASGEYMGVRKNGSTDDRHSDFTQNAHLWAAIGVDTNRVFEAYVQSTTNIDIYLVGYTVSGVTFKTNADDKSLGTTSSWQDIDCATEAPDAIGLIFEGYATNGYGVGLRKNGSTDFRIQTNYRRLWAIIGCDASQICEGYITNTAYDFFLVGYITDGATLNTNATDVSLSTTGSWLDLSALPSGANMGFIEVHATSGYDYGLRKNGSSEDIYHMAVFHYWGIVECDSNRIIEGKIEITNVDFFVVGYSEAVGVTEKTSSDTGSGADSTVSGNPIASLAGAEIGTGVDAFLGKGFILLESGAGVDALAELLATLIASEAGTGIDALVELTKLLEKSSSDSGVGTDAFVGLLVELASSDTGTGAEAILNRAIAIAESGSGVDALLELGKLVSDAGTGLDAIVEIAKAILATDAAIGVDAVSLLDTARALKLILLTAQYRNVKAITSQYRKIKGFTSGG